MPRLVPAHDFPSSAACLVGWLAALWVELGRFMVKAECLVPDAFRLFEKLPG
jgi:hypothetical protein